MARIRHLNPALFSANELTEACEISPRNLQWLRDKGLGPFGDHYEISAYPSGLYPEGVFAELAVIAGLAETGFELGLCASFFRAFLDDNPNHIASRFAMLDNFPLGERVPWVNDHFRHLQSLRENAASGYEVASVHTNDIVLIVAGRKWVLEHQLGERKIPVALPFGGSTRGPLPLGRVEGLSKGEKLKFSPFSSGLNLADPTEWEMAHSDFLLQAQRSVGQVRVNVSLAIRRAFDRVYDLRIAKGGPFWPRGET